MPTSLLLVEEEEDCVLKEGALESLKTFVKEKFHTTQEYTNDFGLVVQQQLRWENIKLLIDLRIKCHLVFVFFFSLSQARVSQVLKSQCY